MTEAGVGVTEPPAAGSEALPEGVTPEGVTIAEAQRLLGMTSRQSVHNAIKRGDLVVVRPGRPGAWTGTLLSETSVRELAARLQSRVGSRAEALAWSVTGSDGPGNSG